MTDLSAISYAVSAIGYEPLTSAFRRPRIFSSVLHLSDMDSPYLYFQSRMTAFGAAMLKLIAPLKEAAIPASVIDQLVRSGTAVGANFGEARGAESRADFVHKLQTALKECREARHWLCILQQTPTAPQRTVAELLTECDQLCAILYSSLMTAKRLKRATSTPHS